MRDNRGSRGPDKSQADIEAEAQRLLRGEKEVTGRRLMRLLRDLVLLVKEDRVEDEARLQEARRSLQERLFASYGDRFEVEHVEERGSTMRLRCRFMGEGRRAQDDAPAEAQAEAPAGEAPVEPVAEVEAQAEVVEEAPQLQAEVVVVPQAPETVDALDGEACLDLAVRREGEYDYAGALEAYRAAADRGRRETEVLDKVMELSVEYGLDYEGAVALMKQAPKEYGRSPRPLRLLAMANFHLGRLRRAAEAFRRSQKLEPLADNLYFLGKIAEQEGQLIEARDLLEEAARLSPGETKIGYLLEQVEARLAEGVDERAQVARELLAKGELEGASQEALQILLRVRGHGEAKRILAEARQAERQREVEALLSRVDELERRGELADAIRELERAKGYEEAQEGAEARIRHIKETMARQERRDAMDRTIESLKNDQIEEAARGYLKLVARSGARNDLDERFDHELFLLLDDLLAEGAGRLPERRLTQAAATFVKARRFLEEGDAEEAEARLKPHMPLLSRSPMAEEILAKVAQVRAREHQEEVRRLYREARELEQSEDLDKALEVLRRLHTLERGGYEDSLALERDMERLVAADEQITRLRQRVEEDYAKGRSFSSLRAIRRLRELGGVEDGAALSAKEEALRGQIDQRFGVALIDEAGQVPTRDKHYSAPGRYETQWSLAPLDDSVLLASQRKGRVTVSLLSAPDYHVHRSLSFDLSDKDSPLLAHLAGRTLFLCQATGHGALVDAQACRLEDVTEMPIPAGLALDGAGRVFVAPGSERAWFVARAQGESGRATLTSVELGAWRIREELDIPGLEMITPSGRPEEFMAIVREGKEGVFYSGRGKVNMRLRIKEAAEDLAGLHDVSPAPGQEGLVVLTGKLVQETGRLDRLALAVAMIDPSGHVRARMDLNKGDGDRITQFVVDSTRRRAYVTCITYQDFETMLYVLDLADDTITLAHQARVARAHNLLPCPQGGALLIHEEGELLAVERVD